MADEKEISSVENDKENIATHTGKMENDTDNTENEPCSCDMQNTSKLTAFAKDILDWVETFAVALCVVVLLFTFVFRVVTVDGQSMENTLHNGERLIISDMFYTPKTGDVIITSVPEYYGDDPLVKRVIATGGQTVDIDFENWIVTVDGVPLATDENGEPTYESYVKYIEGQDMIRENYSMSYPLTVPEGYVFIMGDNRNDSSDSRNFGVVDQRNIIGKVYFRIFPINKMGVIKSVRPK